MSSIRRHPMFALAIMLVSWTTGAMPACSPMAAATASTRTVPGIAWACVPTHTSAQPVVRASPVDGSSCSGFDTGQSDSWVLRRVAAGQASRDAGPHCFGTHAPSGLASPEVNDAIRVAFPATEWNRACTTADGESGFNPAARNRCCLGLFQINASSHRTKLAAHGWTESDLFDPYVNASIARELFDASGWAPWQAASTRSGAGDR
jgi:Lysozyme like domain